jgi:hypothetical protein
MTLSPMNTTNLTYKEILMSKIFSAFLLFLLFPVIALAHETRMYEIKGVPYEMVVGSLGEPVIVDDKTGVSVELVRDGEPVVGAQESLQVELIAGDKKRITSLSPVHGAEGQYKSNFIATVPTTLTYRIFGTLENTPVDLSFTCNPAGHPQSEEDTNRTDVSQGVVQTLKRGAFGCPQEKEAFGFPEEVKSEFDAQKALVAAADEEPLPYKDSTTNIALIAVILSILAGALAFRANTRSK